MAHHANLMEFEAVDNDQAAAGSVDNMRKWSAQLELRKIDPCTVAICEMANALDERIIWSPPLMDR